MAETQATLDTPLDRIKAALDDSPHPRGLNWTPHVFEEEDEASGEPVKVRGIRNPVIELYSVDIDAVCDSVPLAKRDVIVKDLKRGQRQARKVVPPATVLIHVDDAHHLVDLAEGREPPPHNRFGIRVARPVRTGPDGEPVPTIGEVRKAQAEAAEKAAQEHREKLSPASPVPA